MKLSVNEHNVYNFLYNINIRDSWTQFNVENKLKQKRSNLLKHYTSFDNLCSYNAVFFRVENIYVVERNLITRV